LAGCEAGGKDGAGGWQVPHRDVEFGPCDQRVLRPGRIDARGVSAATIGGENRHCGVWRTNDPHRRVRDEDGVRAALATK
jgi:hypothetical protein